MIKSIDQGAYKKGRTDGYRKGTEDGYVKGMEIARLAANSQSSFPLNEISLLWREHHCADRLVEHYGHPVALNDHKMECLKETSKSSIWKLELTVTDQAIPLILKMFKAPIVDKSLIELNIYRKANPILSGLMPAIYIILEGINGEDVWVFMEYAPQLKGQLIFTPDHFDFIIPSLAQLHSRTHNERFYAQWDTFSNWLPLYDAEEARQERQNTNKKALDDLEKAMGRSDLKIILAPSYRVLKGILVRGPAYFPELIEAGKSIIHNDLQTPNIGCSNVGDANWHIRFMDWEGARFAPCWFDMFNLLGVFFAYRRDWRNEEDAVIARCAHLYADEMRGHGIEFGEDPIRLYKMAYLQRVLERSLPLQLEWAVTGNKQAFLLEGYLDKMNTWGKELGLH